MGECKCGKTSLFGGQYCECDDCKKKDLTKTSKYGIIKIK